MAAATLGQQRLGTERRQRLLAEDLDRRWRGRRLDLEDVVLAQDVGRVRGRRQGGGRGYGRRLAERVVERRQRLAHRRRDRRHLDLLGDLVGARRRLGRRRHGKHLVERDEIGDGSRSGRRRREREDTRLRFGRGDRQGRRRFDARDRGQRQLSHPGQPGLGADAEAFAQRAGDQLDHPLQRLLDPDPLRRHRFVKRRAELVEELVHLVDVGDAGDVALVVLQHVRQVRQRQPLEQQVLLEVVPRLLVGAHQLALRVGDEDDAVDAAQHHLAGGVVVHLPRHGVELHAQPHAAELPGVHRQEVEEDRAVAAGRHDDQLAARRGRVPLVKRAQVGRLAPQRRTVVDDLNDDLARLGSKVDHYPLRSCLTRMINRSGVPANGNAARSAFSR